MANAAGPLLVAAVVIGVGYLAGRLATRTRLPDAVPLLLLGLALGPVNHALVERGLGIREVAAVLDPSVLHSIAPIVSSFALVVILFEASLGLDVSRVRASLGPAVRIATPVFLLTVALVAGIGYVLFGMDPLVAIVLGVCLSNVGQTVSAAILRRMRLDEGTRAIGLVEMAIYDIVSIPLLVSLFLLAGPGPGAIWQTALASFIQIASVSLFLGVGGGLAWIFVLERLRGRPNSYMVTLGALLAVYGLTEQFDGAGAVSVLLFGLLVGNRTSLVQRLTGRRDQPPEETKVQAFHEEITFLVRTAFFLFIGLSFSLDLGAPWPVSPRLDALQPWAGTLPLFGFGAAAVLVALPLARAAAIPAVAGRHREWHGLIPVFGHGLGTAVLATLPFVWRAFEPGSSFHARFAPWEPVFVNLAFLVILGSVLGSSILVWIGESGKHTGTGAAGKPPPPS